MGKRGILELLLVGVLKINVGLQEVHPVVCGRLADLAELQGVVSDHLVHVPILPGGQVYFPLGCTEGLKEVEIELKRILDDPREQARMKVQGHGLRGNPAGQQVVPHAVVLRRLVSHNCLFHVLDKLEELLLTRDSP